jgi:hypothetical protein
MSFSPRTRVDGGQRVFCLKVIIGTPATPFAMMPHWRTAYAVLWRVMLKNQAVVDMANAPPTPASEME